MFERLRRRFRYWRQREERERLLREEMQFHLEMKAQELEEEGMSPSDARHAAHRDFGNRSLIHEDSRSTWISTWLSDLAKDSAFALRMIRKQPSFAALTCISASLGVGACSLIFGLANFALLRPLPVQQPSRLLSLTGTYRPSGKVGISLSYPDVEDLSHAKSFDGVTAFFQFLPATISPGGDPQRNWGSIVTANYFDVVRPAFLMGRGFDAARDDRKGEPPAVVLSHQLWRSRFGSDPALIGHTIEINRRRVTVIGVTAPGFRGTETMFYSDYWVPFSMLDMLGEVGMSGDRLHEREDHWVMAAARLREGVSPQTATAEVEVIARRLQDAYPKANPDGGFHLERAGQINPGFRKMIVVFFALLSLVAFLILATACANVANLLLARSSARRQEIATRLAIGAGRGRLIRQLLTESVILALLGGIGGFLLAHLGAIAIGGSRIPLPLPVDFSVALDQRVMLFSIALSAFTGLAFGLVPAVRATKPGLIGALKDERSRVGPSPLLSLRNILVVAQVSICMVLLICSGLFLRSLASARSIDTGIAHRNLLLLSFDPSLNRYAPDQTRRLLDAILTTTAAMPGVESVSLGNSVPLSMEGTQNSFVPEEKLADAERANIMADIYAVAPRYFDNFGIRLLEGEDFRPGVPAEDIVIINQAAAEKAFPNQNPIGLRISYLGKPMRIIGLVATTKSRSIGEPPHPCLYLPIAKDPRGNDSLTGITLALRTNIDPASFTKPVRAAIHAIDPSLALFNVRTMDAHLSQALFLPRAAAYLFGLAGFMGLLISIVGIYGVISFTVARQTKEIGIRMALGARRSQVLATILGQGLALTIAGAAIGLGLSFALGRVTASLLYGISPSDPFTFVAVPLFLLLVATVACLVPACRAASLDPLRALRYE